MKNIMKFYARLDEIKKKHPKIYRVLGPIWHRLPAKGIKYKNQLAYRKVSYGKANADKIFYVIRRDDHLCGMCSYFISILEHIRYAVENNFIPVVDMQNYGNVYIEKIGEKNAWEFYFEQPVKKPGGGCYCLKDIKNAKKVILSCGYSPHPIKKDFDNIDFSPNILNSADYLLYSKLAQKYIRFNKKTLAYAEKQYKKIIQEGDRVLGVSLRGTDYRPQAVSKLVQEGIASLGHPKQPDWQDVISYCKKCLEEWNCNKIFLATEDQEIYKTMKNAFGDVLVTAEREYYRSYSLNKTATMTSFNRDNDRYLKGLEYMTEVIILTKCNSLVAGMASNTVATVMLRNDFEHIHLYDVGLYTGEDISQDGAK